MARLTWSDLTEDEYARTANSIHEAAHAVFAVLAGGRISECFASAEDGHVAFYDHDPEHAARIGWAGPFAQALFVHDGRPPESALREALADASDEDLALTRGQRVWAVESEVRFAMPAIRRLAARLYRNGSVRNLDVHLALGVRPGMDIDMVRWAYRNRIAPESITPAGAA